MSARPWQPVDLAPVLDGSWRPPQPTVGRRTDGRGLFYPGKVHTVASESEAGKTWLALSAALDVLGDGGHVLYLDFEDDEGGVVGRLLALQAPAQAVGERFHYLRPTEPLGTGVHRDDLAGLVTATRPALAILDGITEAMTLHGLDPLNNADAATFGRILPRPLAAAGAATAGLDHVTKDREGRGRYALGAAHKLNGLDGAAYLLDNRHPFGVGITGRSTLRLAKDRPGQLRRHGLPGSGGTHWYGDLVLDSHAEDFAEVTIEPPSDRADDFRPTVLMQRVAEALARAPEPLSLRGILDRVQGRDASIRAAVAALIDDGHVTTAPGPRGATLHSLTRPYDGTPE